jgi:hypothetical protein
VRRRNFTTSAFLVLVAVTPAAGCGGSGGGGSAERADAPAKPPAGWRTVRNETAGFTIAAPRRWQARTRRRATLIRSPDRLVAITVAADRSAQGRNTGGVSYARELLQELPGFEGSVSPGVRHVSRSPYRTARVDGVGSVRTSRRGQRITVVVYRRSPRVTYAAVVFRNAFAVPRAEDRAVDRVLRSFRAGAKRG